MNWINRRDFLVFSVTFEGGMVVLAYLLAIFNGVDPLETFSWSWKAIAWGVAFTVPMLGFFLIVYLLPIRQLQEIREFLVESLGPALSILRWYDIIFLALLAGLTEEILFRGLLQAWIGQMGYWQGLIGSNLLFGFAHFITPMYAVLAGGMGFYLGSIWEMSGDGERNLLTPILTHALYDYLAFLVVLREFRNRVPEGTVSEDEALHSEESDWESSVSDEDSPTPDSDSVL